MNNKNNKTKKQQNKQWIKRAILILIADIIVVLFSYFAALFVRFEFSLASIPIGYLETYLWMMPLWCVFTCVVFYIFKLYHSIWSFVSIDEAVNVVKAYFVLFVVYSIAGLLLDFDMPRSYYCMGILLAFTLHIAVRFGYRALRYSLRGYAGHRSGVLGNADRVMVIGAGSAGSIIVRDLKNSSASNQVPVCVIDDNEEKVGRSLFGVPIVGGREDIIEKADEYGINTVIFAIPTASAADKKEILNICKETGCKLRTLPGMYQLANGEVKISQLKDVELTDLLGREPITIDNREVFGMISGKTILVTGGGGSIGSELCRQIAKHGPKKLIIFDIYENNAYEIQQELKRNCPDLDLVTLIGSVRNTHRISSVMNEYKPDIVFHAAAHKHVPLMEDSPNEAIKNNVMGTYKTARAAIDAGVSKFVLISTDKAVNPTNIMGATKRICEMIIQMLDRQQKTTTFVAVRFGNVLGSNGSVIPLFKKQIAEGGPVTVTHKDIIRFFMTIPEAVSLVLQASYYAKGGEIFVLDMGEPVKIDDMARNLIKLSGYKPDEDIKIIYTGLRPGEKLYEEKLMAEEGMGTTANKLIFIGQPIEMDDDLFRKKLEELDADSKQDDKDIRLHVAEMVPTYKVKNNA
ncbi:MAG: polysaccharide biosynthesis protein [Clostridiales bacterium]|nr:polysaccharide biosynthesis protein [Clostridiales bacterium]